MQTDQHRKQSPQTSRVPRSESLDSWEKLGGKSLTSKSPGFPEGLTTRVVAGTLHPAEDDAVLYTVEEDGDNAAKADAVIKQLGGYSAILGGPWRIFSILPWQVEAIFHGVQ